MKPTQIPAEQYLWGQWDKHIITDPLEDILKQLDKQTHTNHRDTQSKKLKTFKMEPIQITCHMKT